MLCTNSRAVCICGLGRSATLQMRAIALLLLCFAPCSPSRSAVPTFRAIHAEHPSGSRASAAPEVILSSTQSIDAHGGVEKFWQRPELALTPAFKRKALVTMEASKLLGFGPRLPDAVREIHEKILLA